MNLFAEMEDAIKAVLRSMPELAEADMARVIVEPPRDPSHGDMATNAAMVLAKAAGVNPRELAEKICPALLDFEQVAEADIAGPGFINIRLQPASWQSLVPAILQAGADYGVGQAQDETINVEYVSANPTGPMHVGHARGAVFGDALARLLERAGYAVTREYYINDAGAQVDVLARSALLRMREALGEAIGDIPEGLYPGDYLVPVGQALAQTHGAALLDAPEAEQLTAAKAVALPMMMEMIRDDLATLGVRHDVFVSEQALHDDGSVEAVFDELAARDLIYRGVLEPPKGKQPPPDWEASEQDLFRASQFGDDSDRALKKSDGSWTYFAPDIAYHKNKYDRGFARMIDVWGADHIGYIKRMQAAVSAVTQGQGDLQVRACNLVKLMRDGEPVKMSKRAGSFITLREVVDEVGKDVVRFIMLTRKNDAPLDFDFSLVKEKSRDNPVFYVQYAHARICSVLRNAQQAGFAADALTDTALTNATFSHLQDGAEMNLLRQLAAYPRMLASAAASCEPHRVAFYLQDLAALFHALWNSDKERPELRFIQEEKPELTLARLGLLRATAIVLACGLDVIGVEPEVELR